MDDMAMEAFNRRNTITCNNCTLARYEDGGMETCTDYKCNYLPTFRPVRKVGWKRNYAEQKRARGECNARRCQEQLERLLGPRGAVLVDDTQQARMREARVAAALPPLQRAGVHTTPDLPPPRSPPPLKPYPRVASTSHWSQLRSDAMVRKFRRAELEYERFGSVRCSLFPDSCSKETTTKREAEFRNEIAHDHSLTVLTQPVPPGDVLTPRRAAVVPRSSTWDPWACPPQPAPTSRLPPALPAPPPPPPTDVRSLRGFKDSVVYSKTHDRRLAEMRHCGKPPDQITCMTQYGG